MISYLIKVSMNSMGYALITAIKNFKRHFSLHINESLSSGFGSIIFGHERKSPPIASHDLVQSGKSTITLVHIVRSSVNMVLTIFIFVSVLSYILSST